MPLRPSGRALAFLEAPENARLFITFTIADELAAGATFGDRARWEGFLAPFHGPAGTAEVGWH